MRGAGEGAGTERAGSDAVDGATTGAIPAPEFGPIPPTRRISRASSAARGALELLDRAFDDPVMGFLALVALNLAIAHAMLDLGERAEARLDRAEWSIVAFFAAEYVVRLLRAPSKLEFIRAPRHILDLAIVVLPLATLFRVGPEALRATPMLRLVSVGRVAILGMRTTGVVVGRERASAAPVAREPLVIKSLSAAEPSARTVSWADFREQLANPDEEWFYISGVHPEDFGRLSEALRLPAGFLWSKLADGSSPHIDVLDGWVTMFVQYPKVRPDRGPVGIEIERTGTLIVGSAQNLVTMAREQRGLLERMVETLDGIRPDEPFLVRVSYALLKHLVDRYGDVIQALEKEVVELENRPVRDSSQEFLEASFHLKRQLTVVSGNLFHFKELVRAFAEKRVPLKGFEARHQPRFEVLADEADYRYEAADNVRDTLIELIDLHLNVVSFEMNKVMRILAIATTVALVPSIVGGLLGMNLPDVPGVPFWHVVLGVAAGIQLCLYVFAVKGWLR